MNIKIPITQWDQKSVDDISRIYQDHCQANDFVEALITLLPDEQCQIGASWLLKHHLEQGHQLPLEHQLKTLASLPALSQWQSKLHLLQSLPYLTIEQSQVKAVEHFLRINLLNTNKFVRAWAYSGFFTLAKVWPEYRQEAEELKTMALKDEAPSIKARLRNLTNGG